MKTGSALLTIFCVVAGATSVSRADETAGGGVAPRVMVIDAIDASNMRRGFGDSAFESVRKAVSEGYRTVDKWSISAGDVVIFASVSASGEDEFTLRLTARAVTNQLRKLDGWGALIADALGETLGSAERRFPEKGWRVQQGGGHLPAEVGKAVFADLKAAGGIDKYISRVSAERQAEQQRKLEALVQAEEQYWARSASETCRVPKNTADCDAVRGYLSSYPTGAHARQAHEVLEEAQPRLAALADVRDWAAASVEKCRHPVSSADCDGIGKYLGNHPGGAHATEANAVKAGSAATLGKLKKAEAERAAAGNARGELCGTLRQLDQLEAVARMQHRIDVESGTVDVRQVREIAAARLVLRDRSNESLQMIKRAGLTFDRKRDCRE